MFSKLPERYRKAPQIVYGSWTLCLHEGYGVWKLSWWAEHEPHQLWCRRGYAARLATPDRVQSTPWLEPQMTAEMASLSLRVVHGLPISTTMPEVEFAPNNVDEATSGTRSQRVRAVVGFLA